MTAKIIKIACKLAPSSIEQAEEMARAVEEQCGIEAQIDAYPIEAACPVLSFVNLADVGPRFVGGEPRRKAYVSPYAKFDKIKRKRK